MCFFKTYQRVQSGEGAAEGGLLLNDTSTRKRVFCLCSKRTGCLYCYVLRHAGCGGRPGTLAPPLEGTVRQEADGICSYQPPSGAPKMSVYYTPKCQHTRLPTKPAMKTPWVAMGGCHVLPGKICGWQAPRHPSLSTLLSRSSRISAMVLEQDGLPPSSPCRKNSVLSTSAMLSWLIPREPTALRSFNRGVYKARP